MAHASHAGGHAGTPHLTPGHGPVVRQPPAGPAPDPYDLAPTAGSHHAPAPAGFVAHRPAPPVAAAPAHVDRPAAPHAAHTPHAVKHFHPMPVIGHATAWYEKHIKQAEDAGDRHARAAHKVGLHVTSALAKDLPWDEKLKRFTHCLDRYCVCPPHADESLVSYYQKLGDMVRRYAGQEALQLARKEHEAYTRRLKAGEPRDKIEDEADYFFVTLLGHHHGQPDWCSRDAWSSIAAWRDQWV